MPVSDTFAAVVLVSSSVARTILDTGGPTRLASHRGRLRRGRHGEAGLVIEDGESRIPVIILAPHQLETDAALVADAQGNPLVHDGDRVELVGGFVPDGDPRYPAFVAGVVILLDG